jgi:tetratricopeptide (TPR) repeat protein
MWSLAHLGRFDDARAAVLKARECYAAHLGLSADLHKDYLANAAFVNELRPIGDAEAKQNPWFYFAIGYLRGPELAAKDMGEIGSLRRGQLLDKWRDYFSDLRPIRGVLAYLLYANGQFEEAASHLESICLINRRYEPLSPAVVDLAWPRSILGECYWSLNKRELASREWQRVRSLELCALLEPRDDEWGSLAIPWIEGAKSRLLENGIAVPTRDVSLRASEYLRRSMKCLIEAEQFEESNVEFSELTGMIRREGRKYTDPVQSAASHLETVERLDAFTWATYSGQESSSWFRLEFAKWLLFQKKALIHLSNENVLLAVADYKQGNDAWPALSSLVFMGAIQGECGLVSDARATYRKCIDGFDELGAVEPVSDRPGMLSRARVALRELG